MLTRKTIETTEKFDINGNLIERITREENEEDDNDYGATTLETTLEIDG